MLKLAVHGALGKMGRRILTLAHEDASCFRITGAYDYAESSEVKAKADLGGVLGFKQVLGVALDSLTDPKSCGLNASEVLIDFSGPEGAEKALSACLEHKKALVIGSTGIGAELQKKINEASKTIAIVQSTNMSVGVNLLLDLVAEAAKKLSKDFDIEITEAHHRHKKDSPSGTALSLAKSIADAKGWDLKKVLRYRGDEKVDADRPADEIGMQVIRAGEIIGDHTVHFAGPAETIEITHRAQSRDTFARGSLRAALFAAKAKPGLYSMKDVLQ